MEIACGGERNNSSMFHAMRICWFNSQGKETLVICQSGVSQSLSIWRKNMAQKSYQSEQAAILRDKFIEQRKVVTQIDVSCETHE